MSASAEEILVDLLEALERECYRDMLKNTGACLLRGLVLDAAVTARTRLEKVRLGVVAA